MARQSARESGFRSPQLSAALDRAIAGDTQELYALLCRASGLPGVRANMNIVTAFAGECIARAPRADRLAQTMGTLDADRAPGSNELEILPMCGVYAIGARGAADAAYSQKALEFVHAAADDLRFRVRDMVPLVLARMGAEQGDALVVRVAPFMDGFFHAAAVLVALADPAWLNKLTNETEVIARLDEAFVLMRDAERAAERYPGYKALAEALGRTPGIIATRFGVSVFDMMIGWTKVKEPLLREAIAKNLVGTKMAGRYANEVARVHAALGASAPIARDPTRIPEGMRGRGRMSRSRRNG